MFADRSLQLGQISTERNDFLADKSAGIAALGDVQRLKIRCSQLGQIILGGIFAVSGIFFLRVGTEQ